MESIIRLDNNKKQNKQKTKNKYNLKDCIEKFFRSSYKNIIYDKMLLFDAALLAQKSATGAGSAERSIK